jgi:hypothetical protein
MATNAWIEKTFETDQATVGGVVRRHIIYVDKFAGGIDNLTEVVRDRGFHLIQTGDQVVILCHEGALQIFC